MTGKTAIHWFRKGLRLHDNPALLDACASSERVYPLFILDPKFNQGQMSLNRQAFLLQSLTDLDLSLRKLGSRLFVAKGKPEEQLPLLIEKWDVDLLTFESYAGPYSTERDQAVITNIQQVHNNGKNGKKKVEIHCDFDTNTIFPLQSYLVKCKNKVPKSYNAFCQLFTSMGTPPLPVGYVTSTPSTIGDCYYSSHGYHHPTITTLTLYLPPPPPPPPHTISISTNDKDGAEVALDASLFSSLASMDTSIKKENGEKEEDDYSLYTLQDLGYKTEDIAEHGTASQFFPGGESEALTRLHSKVSLKPEWTAHYQKPMTNPALPLSPSTTALGPYLTMGCLSSRLFYHEVATANRKYPTDYTKPPVSLHGQLLWREYFNLCSISTPHFDKMIGNPDCKQIPWSTNSSTVTKWHQSETGYPWIDACMAQLRQQGWIHHLARHSVACFLTRGDLWQSWEAGARVFEYELLDGDWAINNANWQWLSCSRFFYQFGRCYSPVAFPKKYSTSSDYIRHFLPQLKKMPTKYIYEPWTAPLEVQQAANCIIGKDYPTPIVDHATVSKENMSKLKLAYDNQKAGIPLVMPLPESTSDLSNTASSRVYKASSSGTQSVKAFFKVEEKENAEGGPKKKARKA